MSTIDRLESLRSDLLTFALDLENGHTIHVGEMVETIDVVRQDLLRALDLETVLAAYRRFGNAMPMSITDFFDDSELEAYKRLHEE